RVPWLIPHFEIIGRPAEVGASALVRMSRAAGILREFLVERSPSGLRDANSRTQAYVVVGASIAAAYAGSEAGARRGALDAHLAGALAVAMGPDSGGPAVPNP